MDKLSEFINNHDIVKHGGCHNIYHITTEDSNGNITDEKFGVNILTTQGLEYFTKMYNSGGYPNVIQLGSDGTTPTINDTAIGHLEFTISGQNIDNAEHIIAYYPGTGGASGIIASRRAWVSSYVDYNVSGVTDPVDIREIAILRNTRFMTHSLIYDVSGQPTYITKNPNEKMNVIVYFFANIEEDLINSLYANGKYVTITPSQIFSYYGGTFGSGRPEIRGRSARALLFANRESQMMYPKDYSGNPDVNNVVSATYNNTAEPVITEKYNYISSIYCMDYTNYTHPLNARLLSSVYSICEYPKLSTPESVISYNIYTNNVDDDSISNSFGDDLWGSQTYNQGGWGSFSTDIARRPWDGRGALPVNDIDISSSYMYNHYTQDWDIADTVVNKPNAYYTHPFLIIPGEQHILTTQGDFDTKIIVYPYINPNTSVPIKSIKMGSSTRIYATDKYWDYSTYVEIDDPMNIPVALSTKKYYVTTGLNNTGDSLYDIRIQDTHEITCSESTFYTPSGTIPMFNNNGVSNPANVLSSYTNKWIALSDRLITTNGTITEYEFTPSDVSDTFVPNVTGELRYANDDRLIIMDVSDEQVIDGMYTSIQKCENRLRMYITDDFSSGMTFKDIVLDFTDRDSDSQFSGGKLWSWSSFTSNGQSYAYLACSNMKNSSKSYSETIIAKIYDVDTDGVPTQVKLTDAYGACMLNGTSNIVYIVNGSNPTTFVIHDVETDTQIATFEIPTGYSYIGESLCGFSNYVYFRASYASEETTFMYDVINQRLANIEINSSICNMATDASGCYIDSNRYPEGGRTLMYPDCIIFGGLKVSNGYYPTLFATDDNPTPRHFYPGSDTIRISYDSMMTGYYASTMYGPINASIQSTDDGKHKLMISNMTMYMVDKNGYSERERRIYKPIVFDVGASIDGNQVEYRPGRDDECDVDARTVAKTECAFVYGNDILVFKPDGSIISRSVGRYLPHKITGTTRTITAYNNPKKISGKTFTMKFTNA